MAAILQQLLGYRLYPGELLNQIITVCNNVTGNGTAQALTGTNITLNGTYKMTPQIVTTAGVSQATATAITKALAIITVNTSVSTRGVRLPTASTGLMVYVANAATTFGAKVWPATNGKIGAAATNIADTVLAKNKANLYIAQNTTFWVVQRGA